jgi:hypothetical protein
MWVGLSLAKKSAGPGRFLAALAALGRPDLFRTHEVPRMTPQLAIVARVSLNARGDVSTDWSTCTPEMLLE